MQDKERNEERKKVFGLAPQLNGIYMLKQITKEEKLKRRKTRKNIMCELCVRC
jgi:hypothetical protein